MKRWFWFTMLLSSCHLGMVSAYDSAAETQGVGAGAKLIVVETLIAAASYAAAERPKEIGIGTGILIPMAAGLDIRSSLVTRWSGVLVAEAIAYYNVRAARDDGVTRDEILKKNFIGWNIFAITVGLSDHYFSVDKRAAIGPQLALWLSPETRQNGIQVSLRF